jgi:putative peptide zinc metalloprotease protein
LILCSIATPIWLGTPPGTLVHDGAHFIMMMTGLASLLLNWNPLMKLDGYFMLCEVVGVRDLKEDSTAYVAGWVKHHIWRLPVEVPYVPKRRRLAFVVYALLSGAYSYMVLFILAGFAGNFVRNFSPEWGFVPEIAVALVIFRSRIRLLGNFMKLVYLDKKDRVAAWFTPQRSVATAITLAALLLLPVWRESVTGQFVFEPARTEAVRARMAGAVLDIEAHEGQQVRAGQLLASLSNLPFVSEYEDARSRLILVNERVNAASLQHSDYGTALKEYQELQARVQELTQRKTELRVVSPISGTVISPRVSDLVGAYVKPGDQLMEVADLDTLRARIYVSEWDVSKVAVKGAARLQVQGLFRRRTAEVAAISTEPTEKINGAASDAQQKEVNPVEYYVVDLNVPNADGTLRPGMIGVARIYGARRSLAGMTWEGVRDFWYRKLW